MFKIFTEKVLSLDWRRSSENHYTYFCQEKGIAWYSFCYPVTIPSNDIMQIGG